LKRVDLITLHYVIRVAFHLDGWTLQAYRWDEDLICGRGLLERCMSPFFTPRRLRANSKQGRRIQLHHILPTAIATEGLGGEGKGKEKEGRSGTR